MKEKVKQIKYRLYRVSSPVTSTTFYVEAVTEEDIIKYAYITTKAYGSPLHIVEIKNDGMTPKVAIYTSKLYKELKKEDKQIQTPNVRLLHNTLYRLRDNVVGTTWFIEVKNELSLMEYIAFECKEIPLSVVYMNTNGDTPKVAVYTNAYYKELMEKGKRAVRYF